MENTNNILIGYSNALYNMIENMSRTISTLADNAEINQAIIKTINIQIESIRSQTTVIQSVIDGYPVE